MSDPFEEAKAIRRGEFRRKLPSYDEITGWIQRAPLTWLPGLLRQIVICCVVRKPFQDGMMVEFVKRVELENINGVSEASLRSDD